MPDPTEILAEHWSYDGPHDRDTVSTAAETIAGLVRYVNNATGPGNARDTLPYASDVDRVLSYLQGAVGGLPQLLAQLERSIAGQAAAGVLRDDRGTADDDAWMGAETGRDLVAALSDALPAVNLLSARLAAARSHSTHLGNVEPTTAGPSHGGER